MFSKPNPFDELVVTATDENLTSENWEAILLVCDRVSKSSAESAADCISAIQKRLVHRSANVQLYALALTDAMVKNCDITVHREISSRSFTNILNKLIHEKTTHDQVRKRALELIQTCSFEFRADSSLGLMNDVYHSLRAEGIQFPNPQKPKKEFTQTELDKQKEEEEFQLALALSLSETENRSSYRASSAATTIPKSTTNATHASTTPADVPDEPKVSRVRALYDFQPTEQGELDFQKGDVIRVIESVYRDWWKGELRGKTGIFPVNYVEKIVDPTPADLMKEAQMESEVMGEIQNVDRLLDMLANIDPRKDAFSENDELQTLYNNALTIRPKLVKLIEKYSLKKDELGALNEKFLRARTTYDHMLNTSIARYSTTGPYGAPGYDQRQSLPTQQQTYQGYPNPAYPPQQPSPAPSATQQQPYAYQQQTASPLPQQQQPMYGYPPVSSAAPPMSPQQPQQQPVMYDTNTQTPNYTNYSTQSTYASTQPVPAQGYPAGNDTYNMMPPQHQQQPQTNQASGYTGYVLQDQQQQQPPNVNSAITSQPVYNQSPLQQTTYAPPPSGQSYPPQPYVQNL